MGISWSNTSNSNRRRNQAYLHGPPPPPPFYYPQEPTSLPPPPPPPPSQPSTTHPYPAHPPPPPPPIPNNYYCSPPYNPCCYSNPVMGRYPIQYPPYFANQASAWPPIRAHADTLKLEVDEQNPDHHLVSFVFDALFDGRALSLIFTSSFRMTYVEQVKLVEGNSKP
ncbi:hypothetical protein GOBAR_DD06141 [Gossypium barbadense]|nr:hypothetical protein GOBAR_DD06141 [Gossypium barbadense]